MYTRGKETLHNVEIKIEMITLNTIVLRAHLLLHKKQNIWLMITNELQLQRF